MMLKDRATAPYVLKAPMLLFAASLKAIICYGLVLDMTTLDFGLLRLTSHETQQCCNNPALQPLALP